MCSDKTVPDASAASAATASTALAAIPAALSVVRARIEKSEREYARLPGAVQLLAVSKTHAADAVQRAYDTGQRHFGENYLQEALTKMEQLPADITWHFIGPIQSNKTRPLAEGFDWVHTVDREKIARRLDEQRPADQPPLNILLQVNISGEASKSGVDLADLPALARAVASLPRLRLRGLMAIPAPSDDPAAQRAAFRQLAEARALLEAAGHAGCTELSMGMSQDMEAAIAEGATMVRVGTDIFGARRGPA
jgi:pyridoxal phosphate enzyme (YggS family)